MTSLRGWCHVSEARDKWDAFMARLGFEVQYYGPGAVRCRPTGSDVDWADCTDALDAWKAGVDGEPTEAPDA